MNSFENSSALATAKEKLADFWKDDFAPLQAAGATINAALRADELNADLYHRIVEGTTAGSSHLYFPSSSASSSATASAASAALVSRTDASTTPPPPPPAPLMQLEHRQSVNLPLTISQELATATGKYIQMGLLPEASLAWTIVNDKLYVWSYESSASARHHAPHVVEFTTPSKEHVVTVGLVRPKPGVFKSFVEWCLIIATPSEVFLCAVVLPSSAPSVDTLKLLVTTFFVESEARVVAIAGTETGRVFLGCHDGCVYEMSYELDKDESDALVTLDQKLDLFYDQGKPASVVTHTEPAPTFLATMGKRTRSVVNAVSGMGGDGNQRPRKRVKMSQTASVAATMNRHTFTLLGRTSRESQIVQMAVDDARGCVYTLSLDGSICALTCHGTAPVRIVAHMDTPKLVRLYLDAVSRGQSFPPSSPPGIVFPGGGVSAQAGVGGMDGARAILKLHEQRHNGTNANVDVLKPISIHVISPTESSRLTLVAVTEGGLRLYLSSLDSHSISIGSSSVAANRYRNGQPSRNPLAPSNRLTLCHIRAPPPVSKSDARNSSPSVGLSGGVLGGVTPASLQSGVDKALYSRGVFLAAIKGAPKSSNGAAGTSWLGHQTAAENTVVAACPDIVSRRLETDANKKDITKATGITESMTLPMAMAYGGNNASAGLPGGVVWSLAEVRPKTSSVLNLTANSKTPTETELSIGIPQAFTPRSLKPMEARDGRGKVPSNVKGASNTVNGTSNAILSLNSLTANLSIQILGSVISGLLLPQSIFHGRAASSRDSWNVSGVQPLYRVSKRNSVRGFSSSLGEMSNALRSSSRTVQEKAASQTRAAPLRSFVVHPATTSLHHNSTSVFSAKREVVALNASGLHYFGIKPVLSFLTEALVAANDNVATDKAVTSVFDGYGYNEGCFMCLSLAIGCVPDGNDSELFRTWARNAAWGRACVPKLVWRGNESGSATISGITEMTDHMIPSGYEFKASYIYEGLTALLSRLIRPIWHKPAVVVTDGPDLPPRGSRGPTKMPARVELLLDDESLNTVANLLCNLQKVVKTFFSRSVTMVPGGQQPANANGSILLLTGSLQYNSQHKIEAGGAMSSLEVEKIAQLAEEKNIHSLYRLLHRIIQLLNLFSILGQASQDEVEIEWGLLHGLTFAQLTQTTEGHDRVETLLNSIATAHSSATANHLASQFAERCYLFFSPGSYYANLGLQKTNEALSLLHSSRDRMGIIAREAADNFRHAARHWFNVSLITGRSIPTSEKETVDQAVSFAIQSGSPLAIATKALMDLRDAYSLVEVCQITASNFKVTGSSSPRLVDLTIERRSEYSWEQSLYHIRRADAQRLGGSSSQKSSNAIIDYGSDRMNQSAVDLCYSFIFFHLSVLLRSGTTEDSRLADDLVSASAAETDESFRDAFLLFLMESDNAATLLRIEGPVVEKWLRDRQDSDLLWRYFNIQSRHREAGKYAMDVADSKIKSKLTLEERINWLSRAVNSLNSTDEQGGMHDAGNGAHSMIQQARHMLELARIQSKIVGEMRRSYPEENLEKLESSLLSATELFNDVTGPMGLVDDSLLILKVCQKNDAKLICELWKTAILEQLLPCVTFDKSMHTRLLNFASEAGEQHNIKWLPSMESVHAQIGMEDGEQVLNDGTRKWKLIDNGEWVTGFVRRIDKLGESLISRVVHPGDRYARYVPNAVFPVEFLLSQLQELRSKLFPDRSPGWSLLTLTGAGVPFLVVIDTYERVVQSSIAISLARQDSDEEIDRVRAVLELLENWLSIVNSRVDGGRRTEAQTELCDVRFARYIESFKAQIGRIPAASGLMHRLREIEHKWRSMV